VDEDQLMTPMIELGDGDSLVISRDYPSAQRIDPPHMLLGAKLGQFGRGCGTFEIDGQLARFGHRGAVHGGGFQGTMVVRSIAAVGRGS
jgi:hypothetical protein